MRWPLFTAAPAVGFNTGADKGDSIIVAAVVGNGCTAADTTVVAATLALSLLLSGGRDHTDLVLAAVEAFKDDEEDDVDEQDEVEEVA